MPPPEEPREEKFSEDLRRPTLSGIRMEYMSFDGTVTMLLIKGGSTPDPL